MFKLILFFIMSAIFCLPFCSRLAGQEIKDKEDTFFLVKKKGLMGQLGKSISTSSEDPEPVIKINPFAIHSGKTIRSIRVLRLGFERDINDTSKYNNNFGAIVGNMLHKKTRKSVLNNSLFFKVGDKVNPYLLADNERLLREQPYTQDALIIIETIEDNTEEVDVVILNKDNFPLGGGIDMSSTSKYKVELKNENLGGSGSRFLLRTLYDDNRKPKFGYGGEFLLRNIKGSFINWTMGFQDFNNAFNSGRNEETVFYTRFEKPLVTPYIPWIGAVDLTFNKTSNAYLQDTIYENNFRYSYQKADAWFGYNFGSQGLLRNNIQTRFRKFIAVRGLYQHFNDLPQNARRIFDYRYTNITGFLSSITMFEQNFYRTNFIYGFGRNEDVPQGFTASVTGGVTKQKDSISKDSRVRPYFGIEGQRNHFNKKGFFSTYTFRLGGYTYNGLLEDVDLLLGIDHFTRLKKLNPKWLHRQFYNFAVTKQFSPVLNQPLYLRSIFGLNYFNDNYIGADFRATAKTEAVFYNLRRFWGFRLAPFIFADALAIKYTKRPYKETNFYSALGAGVRTRNENLIFGTIELRCYYFPKVVGNMSNWKVEVSSNIRFKYSSIFIKKPDFIVAN